MSFNEDTSWAGSLGHISSPSPLPPLLPGSVPSSQQHQAICRKSPCTLQYQPPCSEPSKIQLASSQGAMGMLLC